MVHGTVLARRYRRMNSTLRPSIDECRSSSGAWDRSLFAMAGSDLETYLDGSSLTDSDRDALAKERAQWQADNVKLASVDAVGAAGKPIAVDGAALVDTAGHAVSVPENPRSTTDIAAEQDKLAGLFAAMDPFVLRRSPDRATPGKHGSASRSATSTPRRTKLNGVHARIRQAQRDGAAASVPTTPDRHVPFSSRSPTTGASAPTPPPYTTPIRTPQRSFSTSLFGDSPSRQQSARGLAQTRSPAVNDAARFRLSKLRSLHTPPLVGHGTPRRFMTTQQSPTAL
jgi:hypothetical protein